MYANHHTALLCYSATGRGAEYCDERVCLCMCVCVCVSVCLSAIISSVLHVRPLPFFCTYYFWPWLGLLRRRRDTLCTSGFMDDVIFANKPSLLLDVTAQLKRSAHAAFGLAINCAQ